MPLKGAVSSLLLLALCLAVATAVDLSDTGATQYHYPLMAGQPVPTATVPPSHVPFTAACRAAATQVLATYGSNAKFPRKMLGVMIVTPPGTGSSSSAAQQQLYVATSGTAADSEALHAVVMGDGKKPVTLTVTTGSADTTYSVQAFSGGVVAFDDAWAKVLPTDGFTDDCSGHYTKTNTDGLRFGYTPGPCSPRDLLERRYCMVDYAAAMTDGNTKYAKDTAARFAKLKKDIDAFHKKKADDIASIEQDIAANKKRKTDTVTDANAKAAADQALDGPVQRAKDELAKAQAKVNAAKKGSPELKKLNEAVNMWKGALAQAQNNAKAQVDNEKKKWTKARNLEFAKELEDLTKSLESTKARQRATAASDPNFDAGINELVTHNLGHIQGACHNKEPSAAVKQALKSIADAAAKDDTTLADYVTDAKTRLHSKPKAAADPTLDVAYPYGACAGSKLAMLAHGLDTGYTIDCIGETWTPGTAVGVTAFEKREPSDWQPFVPSCSTCRVAMAGLLHNRKAPKKPKK